jgi:uncharacterized protein YPO0396
MSSSSSSSPASPLICSYIHRQGLCAGKRCHNNVTTLDHLASFCSTHYKLKSIKKDKVELLADQLDELSRKVKTIDQTEQVEGLTDEITQLSKEMEALAVEQVQMRTELDQIHNLLSKIASPQEQAT